MTKGCSSLYWTASKEASGNVYVHVIQMHTRESLP